eukprot:9172529-Prorocentrum_lima.AAC.1
MLLLLKVVHIPPEEVFDMAGGRTPAEKNAKRITAVQASLAQAQSDADLRVACLSPRVTYHA